MDSRFQIISPSRRDARGTERWLLLSLYPSPARRGISSQNKKGLVVRTTGPFFGNVVASLFTTVDLVATARAGCRAQKVGLALETPRPSGERCSQRRNLRGKQRLLGRKRFLVLPVLL